MPQHYLMPHPAAYGAWQSPMVTARQRQYEHLAFASAHTKYYRASSDSERADAASWMTEQACEVHAGSLMAGPDDIAVLVDIANASKKNVEAMVKVFERKLKYDHPTASAAIHVIAEMPDSILIELFDALVACQESLSHAPVVVQRVGPIVKRARKLKKAKDDDAGKATQALYDNMFGMLGGYGAPASFGLGSYTVPAMLQIHAGGGGGYPSNAWALQYMTHGPPKAPADLVSRAPPGWQSTYVNSPYASSYSTFNESLPPWAYLNPRLY